MAVKYDDIPIGSIIMWAGSMFDIPAGYMLCDGKMGTPNLTDRFIIGAGNDYAVDDAGGANEVILGTEQIPAHTHIPSLNTSSDGDHAHGITGNTASSGNHTHTVSGSASSSGVGAPTEICVHSFTAEGSTSATASAGAHTHTLSGSVASAGAHAHTVSGTLSSIGSNEAHENRPPYYALAFIMKMENIIKLPVYSGSIIMWSGLIISIPAGYVLCDGQNGAPNLTDRFIIGAGNDYEVGGAGGATGVTLTQNQIPAHTHIPSLNTSSDGDHAHSISSASAASTGAHTHTVTVRGYSGGSGLAGGNGTKPNSINTSTAGAHTHTLSGDTASVGAHTHTIAGIVENSGGSAMHENRPPYHALCYIMKD